MTYTIRGAEDTSVSANGSTTVKIDVAQGATFTVNKIVIASTGAFKITRIYDSGQKVDYLSGNLYSTQFKDESGNTLLIEPNIVIKGPASLKFDITDTSGSSNAVYVAVIGDEQ